MCRIFDNSQWMNTKWYLSRQSATFIISEWKIFLDIPIPFWFRVLINWRNAICLQLPAKDLKLCYLQDFPNLKLTGIALQCAVQCCAAIKASHLHPQRRHCTALPRCLMSRERAAGENLMFLMLHFGTRAWPDFNWRKQSNLCHWK